MLKLPLLCLVGVLALCAARPNKYTDKFDNINLDEILSNGRVLDHYVDCFLDKGPCTPEAKEVKVHMTEALENNCGKCTDKQRSGTKKVIKHMINKEEDYWKKLVEKYDPERKYITKYEQELKDLKSAA